MKKLFTLLLLLTAMGSFAQITYQPGYFLNNNGTKTECLIKNVAWKDNPVEFDYKLTETADIQKGYIKSVTEFSVSGYKYVRFTVEIDRASNDLATMSVVKEPQYITETLFLKVLVEGKANLYEYVDRNMAKLFYSTGSHDTAKQLIYKPYFVNSEVAYNNQFRGQLFEIMKDETPNAKNFKHIRYDRDALIKLFTEYDGINGQEVKDASKSLNKTTINFKITAGAVLNSLTARQSLTLVESEHDFSPKASLSIGAEVEVLLPFNNNKWSLFINPSYQHYKDHEKKDNWRVDYTFIDLPIGLRHYMYVGKKSRFFINAAYVLGAKLNESKISTEYSRNVSLIPLPATISNATNFAAGVGFSYNNFSAEARYGFKRHLLENTLSWTADYTSLNIILGYKIL